MMSEALALTSKQQPCSLANLTKIAHYDKGVVINKTCCHSDSGAVIYDRRVLIKLSTSSINVFATIK